MQDVIIKEDQRKSNLLIVVVAIILVLAGAYLLYKSYQKSEEVVVLGNPTGIPYTSGLLSDWNIVGNTIEFEIDRSSRDQIDPYPKFVVTVDDKTKYQKMIIDESDSKNPQMNYFFGTLNEIESGLYITVYKRSEEAPYETPIAETILYWE